MPEPKLPDIILKALQDSLEEKESGLPLATAQDLARISYALAYIVLPNRYFPGSSPRRRRWSPR